MLDPVPLAGARWQVGHRDRQPGLVGEALQLALPQPDPHAVAAAAVGGDQQPCGGGIAGPAEVAPPVPDALDGEGGGIVIDAEIDPSGIRGDVVDAVRRHLAQLGGAKSCTRTASGWPLGRNSRPPFLKSPTSSFFFVSTEIAGWPAVWQAFTCALMYSNWASWSGWLVPSRVLRLACRLKPSRRSSRPTSFWPAAKPRSVSARARWRSALSQRASEVAKPRSVSARARWRSRAQSARERGGVGSC